MDDVVDFRFVVQHHSQCESSYDLRTLKLVALDDNDVMIPFVGHVRNTSYLWAAIWSQFLEAEELQKALASAAGSCTELMALLPCMQIGQKISCNDAAIPVPEGQLAQPSEKAKLMILLCFRERNKRKITILYL